MAYDIDSPLVISTWASSREAYRSKDLRQGLYDGGVVMENVLINLHGLEHRDRRRLENPLFRRDVLLRYERDSFPEVLGARLQPHIELGGLELLSFGHSVMLELAAINAGVDLDPGDQAAIEALSEQLELFIEGARLFDYTGDKAAKEREVAAALDAFESQFIAPAIERRDSLLAAVQRGDAPPDALQRDILAVMVENVEGLELDASTVVRETAFFLLTGASTSAASMTMTLDNIFEWIIAHPGDEERLAEDSAFVQRCILETLRISPISPIGARWATDDFTLADGTRVEAGDRVHIDMRAANRDASVFGDDAHEFDPNRIVPDDVPRAGVSFGHGMHHCIGQELAVGVEPDPHDGFDGRLFGLVGVVIQELIRLGVRQDPNNPPQLDPTSARGTFGTYPVVLTNVGARD